jgi:hypothetical protein
MHSVQENKHETVEEATIWEVVRETRHESINETMQETLVVYDFVDALDQIYMMGNPIFLMKRI